MRPKALAVWLAAVILTAVVAIQPARAQLPPYATDLERLAEILGSLQFLTELCEDTPAPWRDEMEQILTLAEPDRAWRARLTDRFNIGYSSFAAVYRQCTDAARLAITHYREEGAAITGDVAARFGSDALPVAPAVDGGAGD